MKLDISIYKNRRDDLLDKIGDAVAIIFNNHHVPRNRDSEYKFRSDSYFHYFSGFPEAESVIFLCGGKEKKSIIFCKDKNIEYEIWNGELHGPSKAAEDYFFDESYSLERLDEVATKLISKFSKIFMVLDDHHNNKNRVHSWIGNNKKLKRSGSRSPEMIIDLSSIADQMRSIKSEDEINIMKLSGDIASKAHIRAMKKTKPGKYEYQIEAELLYEFMQNGALDPAYQSIVASGKNACILHYIKNDQKLSDKDLLLIDAGCELDGYASDITRTFPISGKFSSSQKDFYELVLSAQLKAIDQVRPGNLFTDPHDAAINELIRGLIDLGLCQGSFDEVRDKQLYKEFFMHRTSHWLGLDVHDAGEYTNPDSTPIKLTKNNVLTIEPGLYIRPNENVPKDFWNIGIRIEDDVCVTDNAPNILSQMAPKSVKDIESIIGTDG